MTYTKYPKSHEVKEIFEYINGELWRKERITKKGTLIPKKLVKNKVNNSNKYCNVRFKDRMVKYHTIVWLLVHGDIPANLFIDHIDGNKINNKPENLRLVSQRENNQNEYTHRKGRLPGCYFNHEKKKWRAGTQINGRHRHIGYYSTEQEAHEAYKNYLKETLNAPFT